MGKLHLMLVAVVFFSIHTTVFSKSLGNFKQYKQITDKEILIETSNGSQVLVSAYNNFAIGITSVSNSNQLKLTSPRDIASRTDLNGSIYVEELDDLMQITTTNSDGMVIKIEKNPLRFTYINKIDAEPMFEQLSTIKFSSKSNNILFSIAENEELKLVTSNNHQSNTMNIMYGEVVKFDKLNEFIHPDNEICMVSSKGYAIVMESKLAHEFNYSKEKKMKISVMGMDQQSLSYMVIYGPQQPELIEKYAFHLEEAENQISLK
jgi:alpha-glucosidase (family GH31 glycosyl hydrolase)